jgi:hypothetical protein
MKKCIFLGLIAVLMSCQNPTKKNETQSLKQEFVIGLDSLPEIQPREFSFKDSTLVWESLSNFHNRLEGFWEVSSIEDLRLLNEELIELEELLETSEKPELFDTDAVNSRLILIKTYLQQLHAYIELDQELHQAVVQILEAHQSLLTKLELIEKNSNAPKISQDDLE